MKKIILIVTILLTLSSCSMQKDKSEVKDILYTNECKIDNESNNTIAHKSDEQIVSPDTTIEKEDKNEINENDIDNKNSNNKESIDDKKEKNTKENDEDNKNKDKSDEKTKKPAEKLDDKSSKPQKDNKSNQEKKNTEEDKNNSEETNPKNTNNSEKETSNTDDNKKPEKNQSKKPVETDEKEVENPKPKPEEPKEPKPVEEELIEKEPPKKKLRASSIYHDGSHVKYLDLGIHNYDINVTQKYIDDGNIISTVTKFDPNDSEITYFTGHTYNFNGVSTLYNGSIVTITDKSGNPYKYKIIDHKKYPAGVVDGNAPFVGGYHLSDLAGEGIGKESIVIQYCDENDIPIIFFGLPV